MTEATERERRHETGEAETDVRYSGETLNGETLNGEPRDREAYDRDRDVDDAGRVEGSRSDDTASHGGPDEAQTYPDEAERELADRDQARSDLDRADVDRSDLDRADVDRSDLDRADVDRSGLDRAEAGRFGARTADLEASDLTQPGTVPAGPAYQERSGYGVTASQPDGGNVGVVDDPDALMRRWQEVQTGFVDDPRQAVQDADGLVQQVMQQVGQRLASERSGLEQVWSRGGDVSTEDLRNALRQYRSFFNRLLHV
jgi:uncharacterized protein YjbI with pentapeptide repeats